MHQEDCLPQANQPKHGFDLALTLDRFERNQTLVSQLMRIFRSDGPHMVGQLRQAIKGAHIQDARRHIHHLKALVGNFDDHKTIEIAEALECPLHLEAHGPGVTSTLEALESQVHRLSHALGMAMHQLSQPKPGGHDRLDDPDCTDQ